MPPSARPPGLRPGCASIRGGGHLAFPNKCRHCDPAPCQEVCIAGAIRRDASRGTVDIDPQRCISCAMCAMACPFGVLTYAPLAAAPDKLAVALKCDQCPDREKVGQGAGLCYGLQGGGPDLWRLARGPGRPRPGHCPGLLRGAPRSGGRCQRHPAGNPPLAPVGVSHSWVFGLPVNYDKWLAADHGARCAHINCINLEP